MYLPVRYTLCNEVLHSTNNNNNIITIAMKLDAIQDLGI